jgi:hypothetical protein
VDGLPVEGAVVPVPEGKDAVEVQVTLG